MNMFIGASKCEGNLKFCLKIEKIVNAGRPLFAWQQVSCRPQFMVSWYTFFVYSLKSSKLRGVLINYLAKVPCKMNISSFEAPMMLLIGSSLRTEGSDVRVVAG